MKTVFALFVFLMGNALFASAPHNLGSFLGLAFSSVTDRHPIEIEGGEFVNCTYDPGSKLEIAKCEVKGGEIVIKGDEKTALKITLSVSSVYRSLNMVKSYHYYYRGTTELFVGNRQVTIPVIATITEEDETPDKLFGIIEFPDQYARTSFEAYRKTR